MLRPGETFVDFACGQNSFGPLLTDPGTGKPIASRSYDILSPAENTHDFFRMPWQAVDASHLPPGELIIGLNPPFGSANRDAIAFVQHALCASPRLLVLIMPATNYSPPGYKLVVHDDQLCRGHVFYNPGSISSQRINANSVSPLFLVYERTAPEPPPRVGCCSPVRQFNERLTKFKRGCALDEQRNKMAAKVAEEELTKAARAEDESTSSSAADNARAAAGRRRRHLRPAA